MLSVKPADQKGCEAFRSSRWKTCPCWLWRELKRSSSVEASLPIPRAGQVSFRVWSRVPLQCQDRTYNEAVTAPCPARHFAFLSQAAARRNVSTSELDRCEVCARSGNFDGKSSGHFPGKGKDRYLNRSVACAAYFKQTWFKRTQVLRRTSVYRHFRDCDAKLACGLCTPKVAVPSPAELGREK